MKTDIFEDMKDYIGCHVSDLPYPELDTYQKRAPVPSQELSDYLVKELTKKNKKKNLTDIQFLLLKISKVSLYTL